MADLMNRLRAVVRSLGPEGAVANVRSEMDRALAARWAVDQLELRLAAVAEVSTRLPDAA